MKKGVVKKGLNIALGWLLLAAFLFAQLPFSAFHDHEHAPVCELTTRPKDAPGDKAHYHTYENESCFVCSGYILKKDYSSVSFAAPAVEEVSTVIHIYPAEKHIASCSIIKVSRGPPASFLS